MLTRKLRLMSFHWQTHEHIWRECFRSHESIRDALLRAAETWPSFWVHIAEPIEPSSLCQCSLPSQETGGVHHSRWVGSGHLGGQIHIFINPSLSFFFFFCCQAIQLLKYGSSYCEIKVWESCKKAEHLEQGQCPSGLFPRLKGSKTLLRDGINMFSSLRNSPQGMESLARQKETDKQLSLFPQSQLLRKLTPKLMT